MGQGIFFMRFLFNALYNHMLTVGCQEVTGITVSFETASQITHYTALKRPLILTPFLTVSSPDLDFMEYPCSLAMRLEFDLNEII